MRQAPKPLIAATILLLIVLFYPLAIRGGDPSLSTRILAVAMVAVPLAFVLRGSRIAWALAVLLAILSVIGAVFNGPWWDMLLRIAPLILLIVPSSLLYIWARY